MSDAEQKAALFFERMGFHVRLVDEELWLPLRSFVEVYENVSSEFVKPTRPVDTDLADLMNDPKLKLESIDKPVDGELRELINTLPIVHQFGCPALEVSDGGLMDYTCQCGNTQKVYTLFDAHLQAAVRAARKDEIEFLYEMADPDLKAKLRDVYKIRGENIGLSFTDQGEK